MKKAFVLRCGALSGLLCIEEPFKVFVDTPADGCTWHVCQHSGLIASKETTETVALLDDRHGVPKASGVTDTRIMALTARLQQSLGNIEWSSNG